PAGAGSRSTPRSITGRPRGGTTRLIGRSFTYLTERSAWTLPDLDSVTAACGSATCTAPPTSAPPAATADNFARAVRNDMDVLSQQPWDIVRGRRARSLPVAGTNTSAASGRNPLNHIDRRRRPVFGARRRARRHSVP